MGAGILIELKLELRLMDDEFLLFAYFPVASPQFSNNIKISAKNFSEVSLMPRKPIISILILFALSLAIPQGYNMQIVGSWRCPTGDLSDPWVGGIEILGGLCYHGSVSLAKGGFRYALDY